MVQALCLSETHQRPPPSHPQITGGTRPAHTGPLPPTRPNLLHVDQISNWNFQNSDIWAEDRVHRQPHLPCGFPFPGRRPGVWLTGPRGGESGPGLHSRSQDSPSKKRFGVQEEPQPHSPRAGPDGLVRGYGEEPRIHTWPHIPPPGTRTLPRVQSSSLGSPLTCSTDSVQPFPSPRTYASPEPPKRGPGGQVPHIQKDQMSKENSTQGSSQALFITKRLLKKKAKSTIPKNGVTYVFINK